jgi:hypothetical protein
LSTWGRRNGLPGYDEFRTGLSFRDVKRMLYVHNADSSKWRYRRRGTVLGFHHALKLQLYYQAIDARADRRAA